MYSFLFFFSFMKEKNAILRPTITNSFFSLKGFRKKTGVYSIVLLFFNYLTGKERIRPNRFTAFDYFLLNEKKRIRRNWVGL